MDWLWPTTQRVWTKGERQLAGRSTDWSDMNPPKKNKTQNVETPLSRVTPLLRGLEGKEPPRKELLGRDPIWGIFRVHGISLCLCFFALA